MQLQSARKPAEPTASRRTRLATCLTLALSLSAASSASMAGGDRFARPDAPILQASKVTQPKLAPGEAFGNIQQWRASHPRPRAEKITLGGNTLVVTNCANDGAGSLRDTIAAAASGDTIDMSGLSCTVIDLDISIPIDQTDLTLLGSTVSGLPLPWIEPTDSSNNTGLLVHNGTGTLTIDSLTLSSGTKYSGNAGDAKYGGCVNSSGNVALDSSIAKYCSSVADGVEIAKGGAIYAAGSVTLVDSVVSDNSATSENGLAQGGGILAVGGILAKYSEVSGNEAIATGNYSTGGGVFSSGDTSIKYSTIADNSADFVGGLQVTGTGDIFVKSSTITGNTAQSFAAGARLFTNGGSVEVSDTTVNDNHTAAYETAGLGIASTPSTITVNNTIVSGNTGDGFSYDFIAPDSTTVSGSHNLIGWHTGSIPAGIAESFLQLGPLQDNGGPTRTRALLRNTWAFNQGETTATQDQRLFPRPVGTGDDIGAFESDALFIGRFEEPTMLSTP